MTILSAKLEVESAWTEYDSSKGPMSVKIIIEAVVRRHIEEKTLRVTMKKGY